MEPKRFGVKTSLLNELRLFQLMLKNKQRMNYNVTIEGGVGSRQTLIFVRRNEVTLDGCTHVILKNQGIDRGSKISLILHGITEIDITFETLPLKDRCWGQITAAWTPSPEKES